MTQKKLEELRAQYPDYVVELVAGVLTFTPRSAS